MTTVEPIRKIENIRKIEKAFLKQAYGKRNALLFAIGINCGLRISDIVALNVGDVRGKKNIEIVKKKTNKFKKFPINFKLKPMIDEFTRGKCSDEVLFKSRFNNRMDRFSAYRILKDICKSAEIEEKIGTHTMRKTFGYHYYKKYKDVAMLQKIFNHSSPSITMRYISIEQDKIYESCSNFIL